MAPVYDIARYLGALYRQEGSTVTSIVYDDVVYTWDEDNGLIGSNWVNGETTLVSALIANESNTYTFTIRNEYYEYTFNVELVVITSKPASLIYDGEFISDFSFELSLNVLENILELEEFSNTYTNSTFASLQTILGYNGFGATGARISLYLSGYEPV